MASPDLDAAADDVCECLAEPYEKIDEAVALIKEAQASGDMAQLAEAQGEMMGVMSVGTRCFEALPAKYPEIDQSEELQNQVMDMAEERCPNPAAELSR